MNIFATDSCPFKSAQALPNILVNKMCLESAQLLSTAHVVIDGKQIAYRKTHENHPSAVWCRASVKNYLWLWQHFSALCSEYQHRTGKVHGCAKLVDVLVAVPHNMRNHALTVMPKCMPDEHKVDCVYQSYRNYLAAKFAAWQQRDKPIFVSWTKRPAPLWLPQYRTSNAKKVVMLKRA